METINIFNPEWTYKNRQNYFDRIGTEKFDVIIIGGGMTGAGVARECALRGIKTLLLDKNDFAFGTSSRSSKLAHGGFRYIQQFEFKLVKESTTERNWLRVHFPNICRPVIFNFASFKGSKETPFLMKLGITLYDHLSNFRSKYKQAGKHRFLTPEQFKKEEPKFNPIGKEILMVGQFYDNNIDDARITMEAIKECVARGTLIALNYAKVEDYLYENGKIVGVKINDEISKRKYEAKGLQVINATGIWTDELLRNHSKIIRPTKGVHVIVKKDRIGNISAFGLRSIDDKRVFFILPREEFTVIGTTDTDYKGNFDEPWCEKEDCDYLFRTVNIMFPEAKLTYDDIISTYAGIRPLVVDPKAKKESDVSRKHSIFDTPDGLVTVSGGKLTIWRLMGEQTLFYVIKRGVLNKTFSKAELKPGFSKQPMLIGLERKDWDVFIQEKKPNIDSQILDHLYMQYGKGAKLIVESIMKNPELGKRFIEENVFTPAEIHYILKYEFAPHLTDVLLRRTEIQLKVHHKKQRQIAESVAWIMAETYGWDKDQKNKEIENYMNYIKKTIWF